MALGKCEQFSALWLYFPLMMAVQKQIKMSCITRGLILLFMPINMIILCKNTSAFKRKLKMLLFFISFVSHLNVLLGRKDVYTMIQKELRNRNKDKVGWVHK